MLRRRTERTGSGHRHLVWPFWRHFLEMFGAMALGMVAAAAILLSFVGTTWDEATRQYPSASLLAIAAGMTIPMAAWMLYRGMGWKNSREMAAAMAVPVIPFLCLVWTGATPTAQCGAYCLVAIVAMLALMAHRRDEYSMDMHHH
jgi:hypothetical protein